jgi:hypothetical protein
VWVPVKHAKPRYVKSPEDSYATHSLNVCEYQSAEGIIDNSKTVNIGLGFVPEVAADRKRDGQLHQIGSDQFLEEASPVPRLHNGKDKAHVLSTTKSRKLDSVNTYADSVTRSSISGPSMNMSPMDFKYSIAIFMQYVNSRSGGSQKTGPVGVLNRRRYFSAKDKSFVPKDTVPWYRSENSGGCRIRSVMPGNKSKPQWCPTGLTHAQKRRVQRLRASEIKEEIAEKKCIKWFNRDRPMVPPKMAWKKKCITVEENKNTNDVVSYENSESEINDPTNEDDTVAAKDVNIAPQMICQECIIEEMKKSAENTVSNETSENKEDIPFDMVFALPAKFRVPEVEVAGACMKILIVCSFTSAKA